MKTYDVKCPNCGKINQHLYLEETDGWMECRYCYQLVNAKSILKNSKSSETTDSTEQQSESVGMMN